MGLEHKSKKDNPVTFIFDPVTPDQYEIPSSNKIKFEYDGEKDLPFDEEIEEVERIVEILSNYFEKPVKQKIITVYDPDGKEVKAPASFKLSDMHIATGWSYHPKKVAAEEEAKAVDKEDKFNDPDNDWILYPSGDTISVPKNFKLSMDHIQKGLMVFRYNVKKNPEMYKKALEISRERDKKYNQTPKAVWSKPFSGSYTEDRGYSVEEFIESYSDLPRVEEEVNNKQEAIVNVEELADALTIYMLKSTDPDFDITKRLDGYHENLENFINIINSFRKNKNA